MITFFCGIAVGTVLGMLMFIALPRLMAKHMGERL
jgi:hypothetical protein